MANDPTLVFLDADRARRARSVRIIAVTRFAAMSRSISARRIAAAR
jgi:hypothetical protein